MSTIALSGGFDPIHVGHIRMIRDAARDFGQVVIILNSDAWLERKKGFVFMPWEQRKEILASIKGVDLVVAVDDSDGSVCSALGVIRPDYFGNGGDRTDRNTPEKELCEDLGVECIWGLGGGKVQSSSELIRNVVAEIEDFKEE